MKNNNKYCVLSLSGGLDSSTLLLHLLEKGYKVTALSFDYGQKHKVELERATELVDYLNLLLYINKHQEDGKKPGYFPIRHQIIQLKGLSSLLNSNLIEGGDEVPEGHYEDKNMRETVVPNRNKIFSSIAQAVALSIANRTEETCNIALGVHAGDFEVYPDCRQEFRDADEAAFRAGNWNAERVGYFTPYIEGNKFTILQDGEVLCEELGLNFDEIYKRTNTSYKPYPSGNSDYKSASSVERIEAFIALGRKDPVVYEDETGVVAYEVAEAHVKQMLAQHGK